MFTFVLEVGFENKGQFKSVEAYYFEDGDLYSSISETLKTTDDYNRAELYVALDAKNIGLNYKDFSKTHILSFKRKDKEWLI